MRINNNLPLKFCCENIITTQKIKNKNLIFALLSSKNLWALHF